MPFLLTSPPPPPPCHPIPKTSPNLPSFSISAFSTKPISINSVHNYGFQFLSHVRSSKTTADMDEAEEERADFIKLRQKMDSHGVKIDSCTPGLCDLLVCPKINTTGRHGSLLEFFYGLHWILSSLGVASRPKFSSQDAVQRLTIYAEKSVISCWPKLVVANTKKSNPCGVLHGKINSNWPSTRESLRLEVLGEEASRIILATDGDIQGQALAEELSRRLGRERSWQVSWLEKDGLSSFKDDANQLG